MRKFFIKTLYLVCLILGYILFIFIIHNLLGISTQVPIFPILLTSFLLILAFFLHFIEYKILKLNIKKIFNLIQQNNLKKIKLFISGKLDSKINIIEISKGLKSYNCNLDFKIFNKQYFQAPLKQPLTIEVIFKYSGKEKKVYILSKRNSFEIKFKERK